MTTYFTRATAAGDAGNNQHVIPLNIHVTPVNVTYYITNASGTGEVSANAYYTIDPPLQVSAPNWFLTESFIRSEVGTTVKSITFPIAGMMFNVDVSGSANYAIGLLQPGM